MPEGHERVVVAGDVLGVGPHLLHRARQVEGQPSPWRDVSRSGRRAARRRRCRSCRRARPTESSSGVSTAGRSSTTSTTSGQVRGDARQPVHESRREVERALVEPRLEEEVRARFEGRHEPHEREVGVLGALRPGQAVPLERLGRDALGVDPQAGLGAGARRPGWRSTVTDCGLGGIPLLAEVGAPDGRRRRRPRRRRGRRTGRGGT